MRRIPTAVAAIAVLTTCAKQPPQLEAVPKNEERAYFVDSRFSGAASIMSAARKVFPESGQIALKDFWASADDTHDFVVFFAGREIKGGFESMYWRYLTFVKKRRDRDWSSARVFDLPGNHPRPFSGSLKWLELNATEVKAPNKSPEPTPTAVTPRAKESNWK